MKETEKVPWCQNSRRWLDFEFYGASRGCPYKDFMGDGDCKYEGCGYYELREPTAYYRRKIWILREPIEPAP